MTQINNTSFLGVLSMPKDDPNAPTMVHVDHVSMVFNIASEQLNSLKEYAIALSRRELHFKEFYALDDVSFEVKQGDVFGILGTNGSGKSTMLKIIAGVLEPTRGTCRVEGSIAPLIELGAGFDLELTARENIFLNGALLGYSKKFIQQHFDEIVDFAEVRDFLDMPMKNYSSGMVARIAFAIATVIVPDVLIVDEVLSVGDFLFQQKCERRIQSLINDHGVTVLIVSHSNDQIERLCNKAVWIEKGHLRAIGAAKEVCDLYRAIGGRPGSPESEKAILGTVNLDVDTPPQIHSCVFGETFYGTSAEINSLSGAPHDICILINGEFNPESRIACSLAGLLDASLYATQHDQLTDVLRQELRHQPPQTIVVVGGNDAVEPSVVSEIGQLCPGSHVIRVEETGTATGIEAFAFGLESGLRWGKTAILADSQMDFVLISLSAFAFEEKAPVFYLVDGRIPTEVETALNEFERIVVVADKDTLPSSAVAEIAPNADLVRLAANSACEANDLVNRWLAPFFEHRTGVRGNLAIITDPYCELDNTLIGPLAGRLHAPVIMVSIQNLDEVAHGADLLKTMDNPPSHLLFIGSTLRYTDFDKTFLSRSLCANPAFIAAEETTL